MNGVQCFNKSTNRLIFEKNVHSKLVEQSEREKNEMNQENNFCRSSEQRGTEPSEQENREKNVL